MKRAVCLCISITLLLSLFVIFPAAAEGARLTGCEMAENGSLTVTWSDPDSCGPYRLSYSVCVSEALESPAQQKQVKWLADSLIQGRSFTLIDCIPGVSYWFFLEDSQGHTDVKLLTAGEKKKTALFTTTKLYVRCRVQNGDTVTAADSFSAAILNSRDLGACEYGVYLRLTHDEISRGTDLLGLLAIYDPNGFPLTADVETWSVARKSNQTEIDFFDLSWYWGELEKEYGSVPEGVYRAELYFDGDYVAEGSFTIKP